MAITTNEEALLVEALVWRKRYEDSNPDYGMGPSMASLLEGIVPRGMTLTRQEELKIIKKANRGI